MSSSSQELTLVEQLRAIAGAPPNENRFSIPRPAGHSVSVVFSPGTSQTLELAVAFPSDEPGSGGRAGSGRRRAIALPLSAPRPLGIKLTRESSNHVRAKEMGINREVQLGDAAFDGQVYINSRSGDEIIREVLGDAETRATIRELLEHDASIIVLDDDEGRAVVFVVGFRERNPDQARADRMLEAMDRLAQSLPAVSAAPGGALRDRLEIGLVCLGILAFVGLLGAPLIYLFMTPEHCRVDRSEGMTLACSVGPECCRPAVIGLASGAALAIPLAIFFFYTIRGQSNSLSKMISAIVITSFLLLEIGAVIARLVY